MYQLGHFMRFCTYAREQKRNKNSKFKTFLETSK